MTSLKGDLRSIMGTPFGGVGHAVLIFSRVTRAAFNSDSVVLQLHDRIEMPEEADGKFHVDGLDPGPIRIELEGGTVHNHGWNIDLPDEGVWSLADLVDAQVDWSPAVIGRAEAAAREARDHADRAEAGADRVGTAEQVGVWASEASGAADAAAQSESNAKQSEQAAGDHEQSADGHASRAEQAAGLAASDAQATAADRQAAGDFAAVATTAATEAVDAMERATEIAGGDFATREYVDNAVARTPRVLLHYGSSYPVLSDFPDARVGDVIERVSDESRWRVDGNNTLVRTVENFLNLDLSHRIINRNGETHGTARLSRHGRVVVLTLDFPVPAGGPSPGQSIFHLPPSIWRGSTIYFAAGYAGDSANIYLTSGSLMYGGTGARVWVRRSMTWITSATGAAVSEAELLSPPPQAS